MTQTGFRTVKGLATGVQGKYLRRHRRGDGPKAREQELFEQILREGLGASRAARAVMNQQCANCSSCFLSSSSLWHRLGSMKAWLLPYTAARSVLKSDCPVTLADSPTKHLSMLSPRLAMASPDVQRLENE